MQITGAEQCQIKVARGPKLKLYLNKRTTVKL